MKPAFRSVTDVMSAACTIQDALTFAGADEAAAELEAALYTKRPTSGETLTAVAKALLGVRFAVTRTLGMDMVQLLDDAVAGARALTDDPAAQSAWQKIKGLLRKPAR